MCEICTAFCRCFNSSHSHCVYKRNSSKLLRKINVRQYHKNTKVTLVFILLLSCNKLDFITKDIKDHFRLAIKLSFWHFFPLRTAVCDINLIIMWEQLVPFLNWSWIGEAPEQESESCDITEYFKKRVSRVQLNEYLIDLDP